MRYWIIILFGVTNIYGQYSLTTIDQAWVDAFRNKSKAVALANPDKSTRNFVMLDSSEGAPSTRMTVVWDMDQHLEASDEGKTVSEVTAGAEWNRTQYNLHHPPGMTQETDNTFLMIEEDPSGRLGIKRVARTGQYVPTTSLYFTINSNEPPPSGGYQHAAVSWDLYIPTAFNFDDSTGKMGIGLNAGTRPQNGGSTPPDEQLGASSRMVRGPEFEKYTRPYVYALNRLSYQQKLNGYQEAGEIVPVPQGEWVRYELEVFINDLGDTNGYVKMWLNGVKFSDYQGLEFYTADQPFLVNSIVINDMWQQDFDGSGIAFPSTNGHYWYSRIRAMLPGIPEDWSADVNELNYEFKEVSSNTDLDIDFTNTSGGLLSGGVTLSGAASAQFSVQSGGSFMDLANGATHTATIRYSPSANGQHDAQVDISGGAGMSVPITGIAATLQGGLSFNADAGTLIGDMDDNGSYISTDVANSGLAVYAVDIATAGIYEVSTTVMADTTSNNSFFIDQNNVDLDFTDIWDIVPVTAEATFEPRLLSIRGNGTFEVPEHYPATFNLAAGINYILIKGREPGTQLQDLTLTLLGVSDFRRKRILRSPASLGFFQ